MPDIITSDADLTDSFYSFIYLAQAIGQAASSVPATLHIIVNHLVNVQGQDSIQPLKATLFGPARSLPHEYAQLHCRVRNVVVSNLFKINFIWCLRPENQLHHKGRAKARRVVEKPKERNSPEIKSVF